MTPFEKAGYTHETRFRVLGGRGDLYKGDIVKLREDDGTGFPYFTTEDGRWESCGLPCKVGRDLEVVKEGEKIEKPKIIQIVEADRRTLGLGSNGITYRISGGIWVKHMDGIGD